MCSFDNAQGPTDECVRVRKLGHRGKISKEIEKIEEFTQRRQKECLFDLSFQEPSRDDSNPTEELPTERHYLLPVLNL